MLDAKRGKVWGTTQCLFRGNNVELHRITVRKGGFSSKHQHAHKFNKFVVESGSLEVVIYREDAGRIIEDVTTLRAGDSTYVEPGLFHRFQALEETTALEVYWVQLDQGDIFREDVGGIEGGE